MGLYNTQRAPFSPRSTIQQNSMPQPPPTPPAPYGVRPTGGGAQYGVRGVAGGPPPMPPPSPYHAGQGMMNSNPTRNTNPNNMAASNGVVAGQEGPQMQVPQGPAFDPNDPQNAALAGYMAR